MSIVAIVLALVDRSKKKAFSGFTIAGLICGIIGIVVPIAYILINLASIDFDEFRNEFWDEYNKAMNGEMNFD